MCNLLGLASVLIGKRIQKKLRTKEEKQMDDKEKKNSEKKFYKGGIDFKKFEKNG